ncbi:MAG: TM2 domain-containing protein [Dehalococcoidia bacterium]|nr:TM2 domain-containing protein [Dehalococcoidia bacterium]
MKTYPAAQIESSVSPSSRLAVTLLAAFAGTLGIHRFYLRKIGTGVLMLVTCGGLGVWALIDFVMAICGEMKDKDGLPITKW